MSPKITETQSSALKQIGRISGGLAIGAFLVAIPLAYSSPITELSPWQIGVALAIVIGCGAAVGRWGDRFVDVLAGVVESTGL
jgi:prolipoprotein diacylglyceryltransferase